MKKTALKLFSISLCLIFAIGVFAACGNKNDGTFVIGCTGPLTGSATSYGNSVKKSAELAVEEINALGGDIKFTFIMEDDEADAEKASTAYDSLMSKGMVVSIGSVTSGSCISFAEQSVKDNLFFITPSASADDAIKNSNGYRICFGDPDQGKYAAQTLVDAGYEKIGVIYNDDDAYSTGLLAGFEEEMIELGAQSKYEKVSFAKDTKQFDTQVSTLAEAECDVIFLPIYYQEASLIIKEISKDSAWNPAYFGCDGMDGIVKHNATDEDMTAAINGLTYLTPFDVNDTDEKVKHFVDAYKAKYNETPDQFAADAYDAIYVVYEAMKKAEITDPSIDPSDLCDAITGVINGDFKYKGVTGEMTWAESGAATKPPKVVKVDTAE